MSSGRPPEELGADWMKPDEAAEVLGISSVSVKRWIRSGRLEGRAFETPAGEPRWQCRRESVMAEAERMGRVPKLAQVEQAVEEHSQVTVEQVVETVRAIFADSDERLVAAHAEDSRKIVEGIARAIMTQRDSLISVRRQSDERLAELIEAIGAEVGRAVAHQESEVSRRLQGLEASFNRAFDSMQAASKREEARQEETLELQRRLVDSLGAVQQAEEERREAGIRERRSFWRRLFTTTMSG